MTMEPKMIAKAMARQVRISPAKVRQVLSLIRGKGAGEAMTILRFSPQRAARVIFKVLQSAVANAEHNHEMNAENLYVSTAIANPGPILKRGRIASRRGFVRINKRTTHITIGVSEKA